MATNSTTDASRYAEGMDIPTVSEDIEVPQADLGLLAQIEETAQVQLPSFDDFMRRGPAAGSGAPPTS